MNETEKKEPEKQVVSKKRVSDHGEVFTASREVNAMLDLVKQETERIDSRFLEPACGTGNFLAEVLERKLNVVKSRYAYSQIEYELYAVLAVSSIYGLDILQDNVEECRNRLFEIFNKHYTLLFKDECKEECKSSVNYLLAKNIILGDALDLTNPITKKPIIFSEWSAFNGSKLQRRDFTFQGLLQYDINEVSLFSDLGDKVFIPKPIAEYPLIDFMRLADAEY